jgi:hypothetical protein
MQMVGNLSLTSTSNKICHFFSIGKLMVGKWRFFNFSGLWFFMSLTNLLIRK